MENKMENIINCPHCNEEINIKRALQNQVSGEVNAVYQSKYAAKDQEYEAKDEVIKAKENEILAREKALEESEHKKKLEDEKTQAQINKGIEEGVNKLKTTIEKEINSKYEPLLEESAEDKKIILAFEQKAIKAIRDEATKETAQKKRDEEIRAEEAKKHQADTDSKLELQRLEYEQKMKQMHSTFERGAKQAVQGSVQIQGEAGEVSIEKYLENTYLYDKVEPIKPGAKGADLLLNVSNDGRIVDGTIYIEIKRHKDYKKTWIPKFKNDLLERNADIGLLVTEAMPKGISKPTLIDDIWVCSFSDYQIVVEFLRQTVIEVSQVEMVNKNAIDKKSLVFGFVTSKEFARIMDTVYNCFVEEGKSIDYDERLWQASLNKRRKNLEVVKKLVGLLVGSFQSYCGDSISEIKALEMDEVA